jgi:SAM-dependent methyltransferase
MALMTEIGGRMFWLTVHLGAIVSWVENRRPGEAAPMTDERYGECLFDVNPTELERLRLLEGTCDPFSTRCLRQLGIQPGWRCLEVGAGAGSIAGWLADQAGASSVTATDLTVEHLGELAARGVRVLAHDITTDPPPEQGYDLIHVRNVLVHLRQRHEVVARLASWLAPGGWLVVQDADSDPDLINHPAVRASRVAFIRLLTERIGTDFHGWAKTLPLPLEAAGLVDATVEGQLRSVRGGTALARLGQLNLRRLGAQIVEAGLLSAQELDAADSAFGDPALLDYAATYINASARRPRP